MGVNIDRVVVLTFLLGGLLAGAAGTLFGIFFEAARYNIGFLPGHQGVHRGRAGRHRQHPRRAAGRAAPRAARELGRDRARRRVEGRVRLHRARARADVPADRPARREPRRGRGHEPPRTRLAVAGCRRRAGGPVVGPPAAWWRSARSSRPRCWRSSSWYPAHARPRWQSVLFFPVGDLRPAGPRASTSSSARPACSTSATWRSTRSAPTRRPSSRPTAGWSAWEALVARRSSWRWSRAWCSARPTLRLRGDYLAIVTLGFGEIVRIVGPEHASRSGEARGITGIPHPSGVAGVEFGLDPLPYYYLDAGRDRAGDRGHRAPQPLAGRAGVGRRSGRTRTRPRRWACPRSR